MYAEKSHFALPRCSHITYSCKTPMDVDNDGTHTFRITFTVTKNRVVQLILTNRTLPKRCIFVHMPHYTPISCMWNAHANNSASRASSHSVSHTLLKLDIWRDLVLAFVGRTYSPLAASYMNSICHLMLGFIWKLLVRFPEALRLVWPLPYSREWPCRRHAGSGRNGFRLNFPWQRHY